MISRSISRAGTCVMTAGAIAFLFIALIVLCCGCFDVEPEELPPAETPPPDTVVTTVSTTVPAATPDTTGYKPPEVRIVPPRTTQLYTGGGFPPEVTSEISDFTTGKTTDSINAFLRWESVRAKTGKEDTARIRQQIARIDYAFFNSTIHENISVYVGVSSDQVRRIRNDSVFSENGYAIASYDPSIIYHRLVQAGRDSEGYVTMCAIDLRPGDRGLFVNASEREFLLLHGGIWDVAGEDTYRKLDFSADSIPKYNNIIPMDVRIIRTREHP